MLDALSIFLSYSRVRTAGLLQSAREEKRVLADSISIGSHNEREGEQKEIERMCVYIYPPYSPMYTPAHAVDTR